MAKSQLRFGAVMSYLNMAVGSLIPMIYTPLMLQLLGQSEYGLYKLASTVTSYLSLISFGVGSAVVRYLVKYKTEGDKEGEQKMFGLFNIIFTIISGITLIAGIIICSTIHLLYSNSLTPYELQEMRILVLILTINTAVNFSTTAYTSVVTCHEKFVFLQFVNLLLTVITPIANIIVLLLGYKSIGMTISSLVLSIIVRIVYTVYVKKAVGIKPIYRNMPIHLIKELLIFSFWIFIGQIVNQLYSATDTIIIGAIPTLATVGVAIYNIGATFNNMMLSFTQGINSVLTPKINTMVFSGSDSEELTDLVIRYGRLQCYIVGLVCSGFIVFGNTFICLWAGESYSDAYWVALFTMIPSCIPLIQSTALNIVVAQNKHRFRALVYLAIAIINVVGTLVAVRSYGIVGAAVVSGVAYTFGTGFVMNWYYWKKIKLNIPRYWKSVLGVFVIPTVLSVVFMFISNYINLNNWILLFSAIIIFAILFFVFSWLLVMNEYEKDILRAPLKKVINKFKNK